MPALSPKGACDIVYDTFLLDPMSLERERAGSWPRTPSQIQGVRQAKHPPGVHRPLNQQGRAVGPESRLGQSRVCGKFPSTDKVGAEVRAIAQRGSCSLGLARLSASTSRTSAWSHQPHSTGQAGQGARQDSRDRLYLLMGEDSRSQSKEVWAKGGTGAVAIFVIHHVIFAFLEGGL